MNIKEIISELKENLSKTLHSEPHKIILFGSSARNEMQKHSDIDVLIILNNAVNWRIKDIIYDICSSLNVKYDIWIDVSLISLNDMQTIRGRQPFIENALREGIVL